MLKEVLMLKDKFAELEEAFIQQWGEYKKLHDELDTYRGRDLGTDTEKVNKILYDIQTTFVDMYPLFTFVTQRYSFVAKAISDYNKFIEQLKESGATNEQQTIN